MNDRVAVVIPGCNERFMQATIDSLLAGAAGEVEIIAVIDGGPDNPIRSDPRVRVVRNIQTVGMRESVNRIAPTLSARYLMKCDAHCLFAEGWDAALKSGCDDDWVAVPARHSIDPKTWTVCGRGGRALDLEWGGIAYHYITFPYAPSMYGYGIHGREFPRDLNKALNIERQHLPVDDLMSFQGSCWFTTTANFARLGPLDQDRLNFYSEAIEVGMRQWMSGGRVVVVKNTWYAHYHKGNNNLHTLDGRTGRGFFLRMGEARSPAEISDPNADTSRWGKRESEAYSTDFWLNDRMPGATRTFAWLIDHFGWLIDRIPNDEKWPADWADPKYREVFLHRPADKIPAHI